jgi:large subunit ribosomal protein L21
MLAVIATGGKQYLVKTGEEIKIEKLIAKEGETVKFEEILLTANDDGSNVKLGKPFVSGASVTATVVKQGRAKTVRVEKFKSKVRYHKVYGHRQPFTTVKIV